MGAMMSSDASNQAKAIQQQHEKRPPARNETPQQARLRMQIERERKERPMTGGVK